MRQFFGTIEREKAIKSDIIGYANALYYNEYKEAEFDVLLFEDDVPSDANGPRRDTGSRIICAALIVYSDDQLNQWNVLNQAWVKGSDSDAGRDERALAKLYNELRKSLSLLKPRNYGDEYDGYCLVGCGFEEPDLDEDSEDEQKPVQRE